MTLTRRYRFSASHRLASPALTDEQNRATYGKCANPFGHGHDYVLDVTVRGPFDAETGRIVDLATLDRVVNETIVTPWEHANLNADVAEFRGDLVPTSENVAQVVEQRLSQVWRHHFETTQLAKIRIEETKRNIFEVVRQGVPAGEWEDR
jgi:6-pyruvoyltetrahydropterin/6-carboxytetrahydropterin synthase